tara:strand:+ start:349 stop:555 length:207 start_codon:yes stop_codon:yes gene_type:complete
MEDTSDAPESSHMSSLPASLVSSEAWDPNLIQGETQTRTLIAMRKSVINQIKEMEYAGLSNDTTTKIK